MANTVNPAITQTIAPNLPVAPEEYSQQYQNQIYNALRLYFNQIDSFTRAASVVQYGPTANRPGVGVNIGQMFFDQTLGIPIWWSGKNWVNASGSTV